MLIFNKIYNVRMSLINITKDDKNLTELIEKKLENF